MPDLVNTGALHDAVNQLARAVDVLAQQAGDVSAVRRLRHDIERIRLDMGDCNGLQRVVPPPRPLEVIPDTPYSDALWQGVDDEGLGGFHAPHPPTTKPRPHHR